MIKYEHDGLTRINKTTARKLFNNGITLRVCMCKVNPTNEFYHLYTDIVRDGVLFANTKDFNKFVDFFTAHNACYELGYYMSFYKIG